MSQRPTPTWSRTATRPLGCADAVRATVVRAAVAATLGVLTACAGPVPRPPGPDRDLLAELRSVKTYDLRSWPGYAANDAARTNAYWSSSEVLGAAPVQADPTKIGPVTPAADPGGQAAGRRLLVRAPTLFEPALSPLPSGPLAPDPGAVTGLAGPAGSTGGADVGSTVTDAPPVESGGLAPGGLAASTAGRLFFTISGVSRSCTATLVNAGDQTVAVTAGHCLYSDGSQGPRSWATNIMFAPGYRDGVFPQGRHFATRSVVTRGWEREARWGEDVGFVELGADASRYLTTSTGAQGLAFNTAVPRTVVTAVGYPAAAPFDGATPRVCRGDGAGAAPDRVVPDAPALACVMTAGYSGGSWLAGFDATTETGEVVAVASHDYGTGTIYGAPLGPGALEAFQRIGGGLR